MYIIVVLLPESRDSVSRSPESGFGSEVRWLWLRLEWPRLTIHVTVDHQGSRSRGSAERQWRR